jgi:uncharacterized protein
MTLELCIFPQPVAKVSIGIVFWSVVSISPALGHPARLSGRAEVMRHVTWFLSAVENFRFIDPKVYPFADPQSAVAQVRAEGIIKTTGRIYRQEYVVFLRAAKGKILFIREHADSRSRALVTSELRL